MADQDLMSARSQESGRSGRLQTLRIRVSSVGHVLLKYAASLRPTAAWFSHGQPQPAPRERALKAAIVQDAGSGRVLMLAWMNEEALRRTRERGQAWFWSRSRAELWHKGATSGSFLNVEELHEDCDGDAILLKVRAKGPACHTGAESCFAPWLWRRVAERAKKRPEGSYVVSLLEKGPAAAARKVAEEGVEAALAAVSESDQRLVEEVADLWFHSYVLLASRGLDPAQVEDELKKRIR